MSLKDSSMGKSSNSVKEYGWFNFTVDDDLVVREIAGASSYMTGRM